MAERAPLLLRVVAIGGAVILMVVVTLVVAPQVREARDGPEFPPVGPLIPPTTPIAAEARPYRLRPGGLAVAPDVERRAEAQPRTLQAHRSLRAYPGAPPRIPHGLTEQEFRYGLCNSCHARGGFAPRFAAYTPVTPHPELTGCLQCHAPDAMTVGMGIPALTQDVICGQCHVDPDDPPPSLVALDWVAQEWPQLGGRAMEGGPLWIPHGLQLREDCLACHGGPSAIPAIRTTHPERVDCRSCHVPAPGGAEDVFERPLDGREGRE
jgi:hypothetical protein